MAISKFWNQMTVFSASEAAYLILGLEPVIKVPETLASHKFLYQEMHKAYLDICAHFRFCLERNLDPNETTAWLWQDETDDELIGLASVDMTALMRQIESAKNQQDFVQYRYQTLFWLERAIDEFHLQRFARERVSSWLYWREIDSEFEFEPPEEKQTPEKRREEVRRLMVECGGNKSEVARRLSVSRTRIDQLLSSEKESRKPLQFQAQDPFGLTRN